MIGSAFIKRDELNLRLEWLAIDGEIETISTPTGLSLIYFLRMPARALKQVLAAFEHFFLSTAAAKESKEVLHTYAKQYLYKAAEKNLYLYLYQKAYLSFMTDIWYRKTVNTEHLAGYVTPGAVLPDTEDIVELSHWTVKELLGNIALRQGELLQTLDSVSDAKEELKDFSPTQRFFLMQLTGKPYLRGSFRTTITPDTSFDSDADLDMIKSALLESKADIVEMADMDTLDDLICYELYQTLKADLTFKRCKHCGLYFVPRGRTDTEYCSHKKEGETRPCNEIGAVRAYQGKHKDNPAYAAFMRAYKRNNSRVKYKKMTQQAFFEWSEEARRRRDLCYAGDCALEEFETWLDSNE